MLTLTSCATTDIAVSSKVVCAVWQPVTWSSKDTHQTIREVKINNANRTDFCIPK